MLNNNPTPVDLYATPSERVAACPPAAVDVGAKPLKTKYPRSTTQAARSGQRIGPQRRKLDAPVPWPMRSTAVPVPEEAAPLRLSDDAMRPVG